MCHVLRATRHLNFKKCSETVSFYTVDFEICFATQRRTLVRHLSFQKCSSAEVFPAFGHRKVLRATTACNFSFLIWPDGSAPAALASLLFDAPDPQIREKHSESRLSYLFAHLHLLSSDSLSCRIFFLLFSSLLFPSLLFSSLILPTCAFHLSILSAV